MFTPCTNWETSIRNVCTMVPRKAPPSTTRSKTRKTIHKIECKYATPKSTASATSHREPKSIAPLTPDPLLARPPPAATSELSHWWGVGEELGAGDEPIAWLVTSALWLRTWPGWPGVTPDRHGVGTERWHCDDAATLPGKLIFGRITIGFSGYSRRRNARVGCWQPSANRWPVVGGLTPPYCCANVEFISWCVCVCVCARLYALRL